MIYEKNHVWATNRFPLRPSILATCQALASDGIDDFIELRADCTFLFSCRLKNRDAFRVYIYTPNGCFSRPLKMALYSRFFSLFRVLGSLTNTLDSAYIYIRETIDFADHRFRVILLIFQLFASSRKPSFGVYIYIRQNDLPARGRFAYIYIRQTTFGHGQNR